MKQVGILFTVICALLALTSACSWAKASLADAPPGNLQKDPAAWRALGYIVVTPKGPTDGGDFGPNTPGTKTVGIQEAIEAAKVRCKDVYIVGGALDRAFHGGVPYELKDTLHIPWMQDFRLDGGEYVLAYSKPHGDAVVFDSQMNCHYKMGVILSTSDGAVVRFGPTTKGPDKFSVITASTFDFAALVGGGSVYPDGVKGKGTGLLLDGSKGSIYSNRITCEEIVACERGIHITQNSSNNWISVPFMHLCNMHIRLGDPGCTVSSNRINAFINGEGLRGSAGVDIFGQRNILTLDIQQVTPGKGIIFEPDSRDNLVTVLNTPGGIINEAQLPTNRIIPAGPVGFADVTTPAVPSSGQAVTNSNPYPVDIIVLSAGDVSDWTLFDAEGQDRTVHAGFTPGQFLSLDPGERLRLTYRAAPTWVWKARR